MASYQRGFGDTILRYADRTYDGAQWVKLQEADSLTEIIPADPTARTRFASVAGWDSDTFCVTANAGWRNDVFFWFDDGHWSARGEVKGNADAYRVETRFIDAETLVYFGAVRAAIVSPAGVTEYDDDFLKWRPGEISVVSDDLLFFHDSHNALLFTLVDGEFVRLKKDRDKEAFVHRRDNTPLKEYGLDGIRFSRSTSDGHVTALAYINEWGGQPIVVRFENGIWYEVEELSDKSWMNFNAVWLTTATETPTLFLVGDKGLVLVHEIGGAQHKQTVTAAQETTSGDLTAVWGVSPDRYWVMDTNGTVWERSQGGWRAVVRGLYRDDVQFRDAWVSPTGTVIAITEDAVYRLE